MWQFLDVCIDPVWMKFCWGSDNDCEISSCLSYSACYHATIILYHYDNKLFEANNFVDFVDFVSCMDQGHKFEFYLIHLFLEFLDNHGHMETIISEKILKEFLKFWTKFTLNGTLSYIVWCISTVSWHYVSINPLLYIHTQCHAGQQCI